MQGVSGHLRQENTPLFNSRFTPYHNLKLSYDISLKKTPICELSTTLIVNRPF
jgi:hypothetical protein